jgi:hypothetical protein
MMRMTSGLLVLEVVEVAAGIAVEGELLTAMEFIREAMGCATTGHCKICQRHKVRQCAIFWGAPATFCCVNEECISADGHFFVGAGLARDA